MCEAGICLPSMRVRAVAALIVLFVVGLVLSIVAALVGSQAGEVDEPRRDAYLAAEMARMLLGCGSG
jgi:putative Mn2+ efflux pump MntP